MKDWDSLTKAAAGLTALLGVLGGLAVTGALERVQREHPNYMLIAVALVVASALCFVLASLIDPQGEDEGELANPAP
jgi:glucose uptake protein GlcU